MPRFPAASAARRPARSPSCAAAPRPASRARKPVLQCMGKNIFHAGAAGAGQTVKICNNMMLAVAMFGVAEAFVLADRLGLERQKLFDIVSTATGRSWALTDYCPAPGPVPSAPSNRDYAGGFMASLMLKDLTLAKDAAELRGRADAAWCARATALSGGERSGRGGKGFLRRLPLAQRAQARRGGVMGAEAFRAARDFLLAHRTDYAKAYAEFRWPELKKFNLALDWFDAELAHGEHGRRPR